MLTRRDRFDIGESWRPHAASLAACGVGTCNAGFGDCDGLAANGCEADVTSDDDNCGACGSSCSSGACTNGVCAGTGCENPSGCAGNDPPQITSVPPTTATEGVTWYYAATGKDEGGDLFTWSLAQAPAGMTINASTGLVSWTPGPTSAGTVPVAVRATDEGGAYYTHNVDDELLSVSGPGGNTTYSYNGRGALTQVSGPSGITQYAYDPLDRLTQVTLPGGQIVQYLYDGAGNLLGRIDAAGERRYVPLPRRVDGYDDIALSYDPGGAGAKAYTFGPVGPSGVHEAGGSTFVQLGQRGDVVGLTDAAGAVVATRGYDDWGRIQAPTGLAPEHGYRGERHDPATGLVYLRARWYDPSTGRFMTPDVADGTTEDSRTLNRYVYALSDPLNKLDRSGEFGLASFSVASSIQSTLAGIRSAVSICLKKKIERRIFSAVAQWAAGAVVDAVIPVDLEALLKIKSEAGLQQYLANIICNFLPIFGSVEFEVPVDNCGKRLGPGFLSCNSVDANGNPQQSKKGLHGIDIVFNGKVPIELKFDKRSGPSRKSGKERQVKARCRFAAREGIHAAVWVYFNAKGFDHVEMATQCWFCWKGGSCGGSPLKIGSVYIGFSVKKVNGKRIFVPDPKGLCN